MMIRFQRFAMAPATTRVTILAMTLGLTLVVAGCGENSFGDGQVPNFTTGEARRQPGGYDSTVHGAYLTWHLPCVDSVTEGATTPDGKPVLYVGGGDHKVSKADVAAHPIVLSGKVCAVSDSNRDIMLVVDVSGSMASNDPRNGNSCARLRALDQVLQITASGKGNRYAIATFSDSVQYASRRFFENAQDLYADLAPGRPIADVICAEDGGTNYTAGLQEAYNRLSMGRGDALKEVFFLSDGAPDKGKDGVAVADQLKSGAITIDGKQIKTTIATVMVGGAKDDVLKNKIASKAPDGTVLHARADAGKLAEILGQLALNGIQSGYLNYRALTGEGQGTWQRVDLRPYLKDGGFILPSMAVNPSTVSTGIEIRLEYYDRTGQKFVITGRLLWN